MSEETNLQPSPQQLSLRARIEQMQADRGKLDSAIVAGFNRQHPGSFERNWSQDFSHENGMYENICLHCTKHFLGHKRRMVCLKCATPSQQEQT